MREVLRDEVHFARALGLEELCVANHFVQRERAVLSAHERDRAESASVVAPFADLEVADVRHLAGEKPDAGMHDWLIVDEAARLELEELGLAYDVVQGERSMLAAHERDRAEGTPVVASLADLEVPHVQSVADGQPVTGEIGRAHV